ncbi:hypothetical protein BRADI_2g08465v3 [Brachypodium distachyon]|uniref:Uncharacterized protein n=1 Tax=Brachypodium distachyon TaxID=15368 RepID=A0A2K2D7H3_BRADI|nr:hypothetical protein BRADI_2g08465v3 [Brachypodium distachyon]
MTRVWSSPGLMLAVCFPNFMLLFGRPILCKLLFGGVGVSLLLSLAVWFQSGGIRKLLVQLLAEESCPKLFCWSSSGR